MSRSARAANGFLASLVQYATQVAVQICLAPVVLRMAGRETLGAYAAIMQALGFLALVDIVGSWSLERFLAQATGSDDDGLRFRQIFTTARTILLATNSAFAVLVVAFSFALGKLLHLSPPVAREASHALYVIAAWAVLRTPLAAYGSASIATQDIAATNYIAALGGVLRTVASLVFVLCGAGLFGLMLSGTLAEAVANLLYRRRFLSRNPKLVPGWGIPDKGLLGEMLSFAGHASVLNIGNMLFFSSGNLMAGITNGAAAASSFYTTQMPASTAFVTMYRLTESATPAINEIFGRGELARLKEIFIQLTKAMLVMSMPLAVVVLLFNRDVVTCWVGPQQYAGSLLTVSLALYCAINAVQRLAVLFSFVFGWMRVLSLSSLAQGVANVALAFWLGKRYGVGGITLALVLVLLPQVLVLLRRLDRALAMNTYRLLGMCMLRLLVPIVAASVLAWLVHGRVAIATHRYGGLFAELSTFALAYAALVWTLFLSADDRRAIMERARTFGPALPALPG